MVIMHTPKRDEERRPRQNQEDQTARTNAFKSRRDEFCVRLGLGLGSLFFADADGWGLWVCVVVDVHMSERTLMTGLFETNDKSMMNLTYQLTFHITASLIGK